MSGAIRMAAKNNSAAKNAMTHGTKPAKKGPAGPKAENNGLIAYRESETRYLYGIPRQPIPTGRCLVHNHVKPANRLGMNGFRAWTQKYDESALVECKCDFGGCKAELHKHYRIRALAPPS